MNDFPDNETLIARGKYATLASERRTHMKALRDEIEAVVNNARRALQTEDLEFALEQSQAARGHIDNATSRLQMLTAVAHHLEELKPLAWGKKEPVL